MSYYYGSAQARGGVAAVVTPQILGTVTTDVNSTATHTSDSVAHTVTAGTELLLLLIVYGPDSGLTEVEATPTSDVDGDFSVISAAPFDSSGQQSMPRTALWSLASPTADTHTVTWGVSASALHYSAVVLINLDDIDVADPIGDVENVKETVADANTIDFSLTTEKTISLVIAWGVWQGNDSLPITEDAGTQLVEFSTGTASTADAGISVATLTGPETPGVTALGFTASVIDDFAYGAVEIRGAGG